MLEDILEKTGLTLEVVTEASQKETKQQLNLIIHIKEKD